MLKRKVEVSEKEILDNPNDFELGKLIRRKYHQLKESKTWTKKFKNLFSKI